MKWQPLWAAGVAGAALAPVSVHATVYLTVAQAQQLLFPRQTLQPVALALSEDEQKALKKASSIYHPFAGQVWRSADKGWLVVDQVLGKHEMITYAVALNADGSVRQIEILEYKETYGGQVRNLDWRSQFTGKTAASPLKLNQDIRNISGATLSCRHLTDGVKRVLTLHARKLRTL